MLVDLESSDTSSIKMSTDIWSWTYLNKSNSHKTNAIAVFFASMQIVSFWFPQQTWDQTCSTSIEPFRGKCRCRAHGEDLRHCVGRLENGRTPLRPSGWLRVKSLNSGKGSDFSYPDFTISGYNRQSEFSLTVPEKGPLNSNYFEITGKVFISINTEVSLGCKNEHLKSIFTIWSSWQNVSFEWKINHFTA